MKRLAILASMLLIVPMLAWGVGCAKAPEQEVFKIGNLSSFTGGCGPFGVPIADCIHLAVDEVNAEGGLLGRVPIVLIDEDTETDPHISVLRARKLFDEDKIDLLIGVECSNLRDAVMPEVEQREKILLYTVNYEGEVYSKYLFILGMVPTQEFHKGLAEFLNERGGGNRWYMIGADYVAIQMINRYIREVLVPECGIELVGDELVPMTQTSFAATINRIKEAKPNVLLNNLVGANSIPFQLQLASFGVTPLRAGEAPGTPGRLVMEGTAYMDATIVGMGETAEGAYRSQNWAYDVDTPENRAFVEAFNNKFPGHLITYHAEMAYNAIKCLAEAARRVNSLETEDLIRGLEGVEIVGPSGPLQIRASDHHTSLCMYLTQVENGQFKVVKSYGQVAPAYDQREKRYRP